MQWGTWVPGWFQAPRQLRVELAAMTQSTKGQERGENLDVDQPGRWRCLLVSPGFGTSDWRVFSWAPRPPMIVGSQWCKSWDGRRRKGGKARPRQSQAAVLLHSSCLSQSWHPNSIWAMSGPVTASPSITRQMIQRRVGSRYWLRLEPKLECSQMDTVAVQGALALHYKWSILPL